MNLKVWKCLEQSCTTMTLCYHKCGFFTLPPGDSYQRFFYNSFGLSPLYLFLHACWTLQNSAVWTLFLCLWIFKHMETISFFFIFTNFKVLAFKGHVSCIHDKLMVVLSQMRLCIWCEMWKFDGLKELIIINFHKYFDKKKD